MQIRYYWPNMAEICKEYAVNYGICCRTKAYHIQKQDFLKSIINIELKINRFVTRFCD